MLEEKDGLLDELDDSLDDLNLDEVDFDKFGEVTEEITDPHIKFNSKAFANVLKVLNKVCATSGKDVISKSFLVQATEGKVIFKATDFDTYYETEIECLNTENVCEDLISIPLDVVKKMINVLPASTIIVKRDGSYFIHLVGGDMVLETYTVDTSKYTLNDEFTEIGDISAPSLYTILRDFGSLATAALTPGDRRIVFDTNHATAAHTYSVIRNAGSFAKFDLKIKDIGVVYNAINGSDEILKVLETTNARAKRVRIKGEKFMYSFLVSEAAANSRLVETCEEVSLKPGVYVDFITLSRLVRLAYELPYSIGKVNINYNDVGDVLVEVPTKKQATSLFKLSGSASGTVVPLNKPLVVQAKLFYTLLNSFRNESSVNIILTPESLGVKTDNYKGALLVE